MTKRPRGRPSIGGRSVKVTAAITREALAWLDSQPGTRSEIIARLIDEARKKSGA